jgi:trimeric autotransporter adhesin
VLSSRYGENETSWRARLLKDWSLSGSVTAQTGLPLTARVLGNLADTAGTGTVGSGRANASGLDLSDMEGFFNLGAFTIPSAGQFGNAGRNTIPGPESFSVNMAAGRSFRLGENRRRLEFRVEANNIFNDVNFTSLNTVVNATDYGVPTTAGTMRSLDAVLRLRF